MRLTGRHMLASARQGARRAPLLLAAAAPAESSRQAQVRAIALCAVDSGSGGQAWRTVAKTAIRGYAAAVALASPNERQGGASASHSFPSADRHGDGEHSASPTATATARHSSPLRTSIHPLEDPDAAQFVQRPPTAGEIIRRRLKVDPLGALLCLPTLSAAELATVESKDIRSLLFHLMLEDTSAAPLHAQVDAKAAENALLIARDILYEAPASRHDRLPSRGGDFVGRTLRSFLRACILLGSRRLVVETFGERMNAQLFQERQQQEANGKHPLVFTDGLAVDLYAAREWKLMADLFPYHGGDLPDEVWTAKLTGMVMNANLALGRPWEAVAVFTLCEKPQSDAFIALVQAQLEQGDVAAAQEALHAASTAGVDSMDLQVAMLRGYRALGLDASVEERVRADTARLGLQLGAPVLNAFIRLRVDAGDLDGADAVLSEFNWGSGAGARPDQETTMMALSIAGKRRDEAAVRRAWDMVVDYGVVTDAAVAHLCRALRRLDRPDDAVEILRAAVKGDRPSPWRLPETFVPGVLTANVVLQIALRHKGYDGFLEVTDLMVVGGIVPDQRTVVHVLEFAKAHMVTTPLSLARLLRQLNKQTRTETTAEQVDIVLAEAVRLALRGASMPKHLSGAPVSPASSSPEAAMLQGELRSLLERRIAAIRNSGQRTTPRMLSTRLLYDALSSPRPGATVPQTWSAFVLRGFRPSAVHYLALLRAYAVIGAVQDAEDVLTRAAADGVAPTRAMLTTLVAAWGRAGDVDRARATYEQIRRTKEGIDGPALRAMLQVYTAHHHPHDALSLARAEYPYIKLDEDTVVTIAHILRHVGDVPGAIFFIAHHCTLAPGVSDADKIQSLTTDAPGTADAPKPSASDPTHATANPTPTQTTQTPSHPQTSPPQYRLTPQLRAALRRALNYLSKRHVGALDTRTRQALEVGYDMLADDQVARPPQMRRKPTLGAGNRRRLGDKLAEAARRDAMRRGGGE